MIMAKTFHTYISVHDHDIILEFEKSGKFKKNFGNDYTKHSVVEEFASRKLT